MVPQTPQQTVNPTPARIGYARTALADWCQTNNEPFFAISAWSDTLYALNVLKPQVQGEKPKRTVVSFKRPAVFAGRVSRVTMIPHEGFICTPDLCLIYEGLAARDYAPIDDLGGYGKGWDSDGRLLLALQNVDTPVREECIFFGGSKNFGHFIFQNLLRLSLLNWLPQLRSLPLAVFEGLPPRYLEFLDILGFPSERRILIPRDRPVPFDRAWMLSSPMYRRAPEHPMIWPESIWALRAATGHLNRPVSGKRPRYYLPRGNASWRRLINEPQLMSLMEKYDVQPIDFSVMSAVEQIRTISNAEMVISVLGAASEITIFTPSDCAVIDLSPPGFAGTFGPVAFAAVLNQAYARIFGKEVTAAEVAAAGLPPSVGDKEIDLDFFIPPEELERALIDADVHCRRELTI